MTEVPAALPSASKDYWDIVAAQLARRRSVKIAVALLVLLYAMAIYAPLLAGDRPLLLRATNAAAYKKAQRMLVPIAAGLHGQLESREGLERLATEGDALFLRLAEMRRQLGEDEGALLGELGGRVNEALVAEAAGDHAAALAASERAKALAARVKAELGPAEPGVAPVPGQSVRLVARTTSPALDAVGRGELYLMGLWLLVMTWPLWNRWVNRRWLAGDREAIRRSRGGKLLVASLLPLLPLPFWSSSETAHATSAYKAGLTSGEIVAETAVFPPLSFGLAEQNEGEIFRPPTWHEDAEISEEGRYVRGARGTEDETSGAFVAPPQPVEVEHSEPARNAAGRHALGTDGLGRDVLSRLVWGGRVSLSVGLVSTLFLTLIGVVLGALAGYYGRWVDIVISRIIEIFQCFPPLFLILIVVAFIGPSILNIMLVLGLTRWPGVARLVRAEFLRLRGQDFVVACEALGVPQRRAIFRHILPNAMGPVLVAATFSVASGILTESALSFLGLGVQLPVPSWGSLLTESRSAEYWWIQIFPGLMIFLTVTLYNLLGEGVADALDPRQKI